MKNKAIEILGGMGPEASVYMYKTLTELSCRVFGARNNNDFPEIIINSIPVPDFISDDKNKAEALMMLKKRTSDFEEAKTLCISIACNTAHVLLSELRKATKIPFVSMIEEVGNVALNKGYKRVGIIASPSTLRFGLYQREFKKHGIEAIIPVGQETSLIESIIRNVIAGKILRADTEQLQTISDKFRRRGAECIVLGCTEIPLVFPKRNILPIIDSTVILSTALLLKYYKSHKMS